MTAIYPAINDVFIAYSIATAVAQIGCMRPARKIKHPDILLDEVNFPPSVAREINRVIDLAVVLPNTHALPTDCCHPWKTLPAPGRNLRRLCHARPAWKLCTPSLPGGRSS